MSQSTITSQPSASSRQFSWYLFMQGAYFTNIGIGMVLMPFIVTIVLQSSPEKVGTYQALVLTPMLVLLLFGGAKADRMELRSWLTRIHLVQFAPPLLLAWLLYSGSLSYPLIIIYGMCMAAIGSFAGPARDSMLTHVAGTGRPGGMQRAVGTAVAVQTVAQFIGISVAGVSEFIGVYMLPVIMALNYLTCLFAVRHITPTTAAVPSDGRAPEPGLVQRLGVNLREIGGGIVEVWQSERIRPVVVLMFFSGLLFMGAVMVLMPLIVRDLYQGGAMQISIMFGCLFGGIGISSAIVSRIPIRRQGRALMLGMFAGGIVLVMLHFSPPIELFYLAVVGWGLSAGVGSSMSRTIVQAAAPDSHLARILSVFAMASLAGGPIGSYTIGHVVEAVGLLNAVLLPPALLVLVWVMMFLFTNLWSIETDHEAAHPEYSDIEAI